MEELIQELQTAIALGELLASLGWYTALADQWSNTIVPLMKQLWESLHTWETNHAR